MESNRHRLRYNFHKGSIPMGFSDNECDILGKIYEIDNSELSQILAEFNHSNKLYAENLAKKLNIESIRGKYAKIAFLGDSITSDRQGYAKIIRNVVINEPGISVDDFAITGNTSADLLSRFDLDIRQYHATIAHILIGSNDIARVKEMYPHVSPKEYEKNIDYVVGELTEEGTSVIISTIPRFSIEKIDNTSGEHKLIYRIDDWEMYNCIIRKIGSKYGTKINEVDQYLSEYDPYDYTEPDGVHLNTFGQSLMAETVMGKIIELME